MVRYARVVLALAAAITMPAPAQAQSVIALETEGKVTAIVETPRGAFVETTRGTLRASLGECAGGICLTPDVIRGLPQRAPDGALPDGSIATMTGGDIAKAWYGAPTKRYAHGVLGDAIEGGELVVETSSADRLTFVLPEDQVFEDITPRLHDFGADGSIEIVTLRASHGGGGAVVIYGLRDGALVEIGGSAENGRPNRWLNIAGIADNRIYFIRTPHIGGRLHALIYADGAFRETDLSALGRFSNHVIGSRELGLGFLGYLGGEELVLAVPVQSRDALAFPINGRDAIALPGRIDKAIIAIGNNLLTASEDGQLLVIKP